MQSLKGRGITLGTPYSLGFLPEGPFWIMAQEASLNGHDGLSELRGKDWNLEMLKRLKFAGQDIGEEKAMQRRFNKSV